MIYEIINQSGIKVPEDLSIVSFDESDAFELFYSPLTYVNQSLEDIGKDGLEVLAITSGNIYVKY